MTKEVLIHLKGMQTTDDPHGSDDPLELKKRTGTDQYGL